MFSELLTPQTYLAVKNSDGNSFLTCCFKLPHSSPPPQKKNKTIHRVVDGQKPRRRRPQTGPNCFTEANAS